jgi:hypothetical protein
MYFQHIGQVAEHPSYGHVHFKIDTNDLVSHLSTVDKHVSLLRKHIADIPYGRIQQRSETFLSHVQTNLKTIRNTVNDFTLLLGPVETVPNRTKRFIGLMVALGALSMSVFNQAQILHLQSSLSSITDNQEHIVNVLQDHEVAINTLQHDFLKIRDGFLTIINIVEETEAQQRIHETELSIMMALREIETIVTCLQHGIETLFSHRLPTCFVDTKQMIKTMQTLALKATKIQLEPISMHPAMFLQYETSFLFIKGVIHIYVHVPLINRLRLLDILRFNSIPVPISASVSFAFAPTDRYLAMGKQGVHTTISEQELSTCRKYMEYYFCEQSFILTTNITSTCLGSIYAQNFKHLKDICPAVFFQTTESIYQIAKNEFMFLTTQPQTIKLTCKDSTRHLAVQTSQQITMKSACELTTAEHVIRTGLDLNVEGDIRQWQWVWNVSDSLFDVDVHLLDTLVKDLKLANNHPTPIRDLRKLIFLNKHQTVNSWLTAVLAALAVLIMGILGFLAYRYFTLKRILPTTDP